MTILAPGPGARLQEIMDKLSRLIILIYWTAFIYIMIAFPTPPYDGEIIGWHDKVFHMFLFGVFSYLIARYLDVFRRYQSFQIYIISAGLGIVYSIGAEIIQRYIPGRTVSEYDSLAGIAGIALALSLHYARNKRKT
jgi:VanZ family protein